MVSSPTTLEELAAVDAELEALTVKLERARQKKAAMQAQKERKAAAAPTEAQPLDSPLRHPVRRPTFVAPPKSPVPNISNNKQQRHQDSPAKAPVRRATAVDPEAVSAVQAQVVQVQAQQHQPPPPPPPPQPVKGPSEMAKQKHQWDKPDWALPTDALPDDSIQKDSIQNPLLKQAQPGYERKVHAADLTLISGKFVKATPVQKPDPRLVWIVVNIDGMKVGKIVMHLYGNFLPIVDVFLELKGLEVQRNNNMLIVPDMDPAFYIHNGKPETFRGPKSTACFGVVIEGQDIVQKLVGADPEALITVKQSHIYPVKKAKS